MHYTTFGNSGLVVSRLAFGTLAFGTGNLPTIYKVDQAGARALVDQALDAGINLFDTADAYADGQSETMLGSILKDRRDKVVLLGICDDAHHARKRRHFVWRKLGVTTGDSDLCSVVFAVQLANQLTTTAAGVLGDGAGVHDDGVGKPSRLGMAAHHLGLIGIQPASQREDVD